MLQVKPTLHTLDIWMLSTSMTQISNSFANLEELTAGNSVSKFDMLPSDWSSQPYYWMSVPTLLLLTRNKDLFTEAPFLPFRGQTMDLKLQITLFKSLLWEVLDLWTVLSLPPVLQQLRVDWMNEIWLQAWLETSWFSWKPLKNHHA